MNNIKKELVNDLKNVIEELTNTADEKITKVSENDAEMINKLKDKLVNIVNEEINTIENSIDDIDLQEKAEIILEKSKKALEVATIKIQGFHNALDNNLVGKSFDDFIEEEKIEEKVISTKDKAVNAVSDFKDNAVETTKKVTENVIEYLNSDDVQDNIAKVKETTTKLTESGLSGIKKIFNKVKSDVINKENDVKENLKDKADDANTIEEIKKDVDEIINKDK